MKYNPTEAQQKIYEFIKCGSGNGIIDAVAGAGKTTTLMGCIKHVPNINDVIYCAFNTSIRQELQKKFHDDRLNVKVSTIHSLGFQMLRATRDFIIDDFKYHQIIRDSKFFIKLQPYFDRILNLHGHLSVDELKQMQEIRSSLDWLQKNQLNEGLQYIHKISNRLLDINNKYRCTLEIDSVERYKELVYHFEILSPDECTLPSFPQEVEYYFQAHQLLLNEGNSIAISHGIIDYTDMLYLPSYMHLTAKSKYGFVFVDECQDLSKAQLYIVRQYLREDGRLLAVGDPYQAIYGFAGADCESFNNVKNEFNCQLLNLTDCFRCPKKVISLAQSIRPDINGFKTDEGTVSRIKERDVLKMVGHGDLIICRSRKPLMKMVLRLISRDFKVRIHPDELQEFMGNYNSYFTSKELRMPLTIDGIDSFFERIFKKNLQHIKRDNQNVDSALRGILIKEAEDDLRVTLEFLKQKFFDWKLYTLDGILTRLKYYLTYPEDEAIRISSIHRAKGLENKRVFILEYPKMPIKRLLDWEKIQERNLHYVAVTRPLDELFLCDAELVTDGSTDLILDENEVDSNQEDASTLEYLEFLNTRFNNSTIANSTADPIPQSMSRYVVPVHAVQRISRIPKLFYSFGEQEPTPYSSLNEHAFQCAKYWSVNNQLQDTEFNIYNVISLQYLDTYFIQTPNGIEIYNGSYNANGQYTFRPRGECKNADRLLKVFENESDYKFDIKFAPNGQTLTCLHELIMASCSNLKISNTNIYTENYAIVYCFKTFKSYAYIKISYNGRGLITNIMPFSSQGEDDENFNNLLSNIRKLWQQ